jgi:hypothetical protein
MLQGCEQIYTPEIEVVETPIVVDARIVSGGSGNYVLIYSALGYNDEQKVYPPVSGAVVSVISNTGEEFQLKESSPGKFPADLRLDAENQYKLKILYAGKTYESGFVPVPHAPSIDSVYGEGAKKIIAPEGSNNTGDFIETVGVQLFSDMLDEGELPYFRFTARAVLQYTYTVMVPSPSGPMELTRYAWGSIIPGDTYNIAAPDRFTSSKSILRHPLYFLSKRPYLAKESFMENGPYFNGWILILYQHRLSAPAYNFYDDLNKQMEASGKMFDPLYVQARNNLTCVSNPGEVILGNFEISTVTETRYFVNFLSDKLGYIVRPIPYFYFIPEEGDILGYPPDFWEASKKEYPLE